MPMAGTVIPVAPSRRVGSDVLLPSITVIRSVVPPDLFDQFGKLGELREKDVLTEEEFAEQKTRLLGHTERQGRRVLRLGVATGAPAMEADR